MIRVVVCFVSFLVMLSAQAQSVKPAPPLQRAPALAKASGQAPWVRVADAGLIFTGQVFAAKHGGDARTEAEDALRALAELLMAQGSDLAHVARLNAYAVDEAAATAVEVAVNARFVAHPVAFTLVRTPLTKAGARVAFEAVAMTSSTAEVVKISEQAALLPAGGKIFISGQAEKGTDLASGVRLTLAGLMRSLTHLGLTKTDVVQVKAFIRPFGDHAAALKEIVASFEGGPVPPVVFIEWQSDLFAEIELVASARALPAPASGPLNHLWFPWLTKSPRYSSACQVAAGTSLIFIGALGGEGGDARAQVKMSFARLGSTLFDSGAGFRSLVKASYYLGVPAARTALGDIRDVYFDPVRSPAASALNVASLGTADRALVIDMIAVPLK